jgi:hypothetical protein
LIYLRNVLTGRLLARLSQVPAVIGAITGLGSLFVGDRLVYRLTRQAVMLGLKVGFRGSTSLIVFENSHDQSYFVDRHVVREEQTRLIPGAGVEVNEFSSDGWEGERPVILCASRMIRERYSRSHPSMQST